MTKLEYVEQQIAEIKVASMDELQMRCLVGAIANAKKAPMAVLEPDPVIWFLLRKLIAVDREDTADGMGFTPSGLDRLLRDEPSTQQKAEMYAALTAWRNREARSGKEDK